MSMFLNALQLIFMCTYCKICRFTMKNSHGMQVELITLGATLTSLKIPDKNGNLDDIVLGFNDVAGTNGFFIY